MLAHDMWILVLIARQPVFRGRLKPTCTTETLARKRFRSMFRPLASLNASAYTFVGSFCANWISNSYTMGFPPVRGDNPRALASGLSYVQVENPWYNYFIPPTLV